MRARSAMQLSTVCSASAMLLAGVGMPTPRADAARPCWQTVLADWADGTIDRTYPSRCYRDALEEMPEDLRIYSSAEDDVRRALLSVKLPPKQPPGAARTLAGHSRTRVAPSAIETADRGLGLPLPLLVAAAVASLWAAAGAAHACVVLVRRRASRRR